MLYSFQMVVLPIEIIFFVFLANRMKLSLKFNRIILFDQKKWGQPRNPKPETTIHCQHVDDK